MDELIYLLGQAFSHSFLLTCVIAYLAGFLVSLTPCVYPMIPITAAIIGATDIQQARKIRSFLLSVSYVLGLSVIYTGLGIFSAFTGQLFGMVATHYIATLIVGIMMVVFGCVMLDFWVIPLPAFLQNRPDSTNRGLIRVFLMGAVSGLVFAPCVTPPMGLLLTYVAQQHHVWLGGSAMFCFALGMSTILLLIGFSSQLLCRLPKSGEWMVRIKHFLGWAMLAIGQYYIFLSGSRFYMF